MFVDDQVVIDGPFNGDCIMQFKTQEDRVLAFSVVDGDIKDALQLLNVTHVYYKIYRCPCWSQICLYMIQIHDGFGVDSPILKVKNQIIHEVLRENKPTALYTTSSEAIVRFIKTPNSNMKLKIQKVL
jgi:C-type lectin domain family 10 protein A